MKRSPPSLAPCAASRYLATKRLPICAWGERWLTIGAGTASLGAVRSLAQTVATARGESHMSVRPLRHTVGKVLLAACLASAGVGAPASVAQATTGAPTAYQE